MNLKVEYCRHRIGREAAIALGKTKWWQGKPARQIAEVQLFTEELCMDFSDFHKALEESLKRPVFTHELGTNYDGIVEEFLGLRKAPTMEEVFNLIPEEKRIIVTRPAVTQEGGLEA